MSACQLRRRSAGLIVTLTNEADEVRHQGRSGLPSLELVQTLRAVLQASGAETAPPTEAEVVEAAGSSELYS
ncbi:hypothetical protein GUITHDRAFT_156383 [Guillardia theta CCMP2712]|uniref:Uncharacterized protein n=2 Tax=Guillardia theta TaxID=55529 RepID=L1I891_GUITC|nr:hypothetical protein GUITHDRAFT_156383 [Guillardia theta CCMP2712]EKX32272.1 hypothetical protein GUITHDRAFT_156383 [Guillardia theta CCMP2712]|eukprot:XP_005819252.1 hypothetical protein GUITHDRAFT_156383 [Guillardia theta CCMP2712]